ncbi:hypothetical protein A3C87_00970 [Candidatus Kaiserbacteria bacterium RIFCSPHIGHO2_02_FULL_49_34]|uniref:Uncharacterized protein n=1 Tax=Candidatus Kaiserbacteria bacterium RIFCSPHIGHO2_02_FULL_49_34 TaxID=1798491 RepID=A0A1F6DN25_9BACT|nr:MAG: hypothetical protein A3C87_00970 [Candidatus Kaiserbacteria bacterium RIFCSPHIGHO2_02_FULL_49_34]
MKTHAHSLVAVLLALACTLLVGCSGAPIKYSTKQVNEKVLKHAVAKDGSLKEEFKARYARLAPGMTRKAAFAAMGIPEDASQVRLGVDEIRRLLYGETKVSSFEEAEKLRLYTEKLCGVTIPLESSRKSAYLSNAVYVGKALTGYKVALDFVYVCKDEILTFVQWRGSEHLEDRERSAMWLSVPAIKGLGH